MADDPPGALEGAVPVNALGVAQHPLAQGHVTRVLVDGRTADDGRRPLLHLGRGNDAGEDDQNDATIPALDLDVQVEELVQFNASTVGVERGRLPLLQDPSGLVEEEEPDDGLIMSSGVGRLGQPIALRNVDGDSLRRRQEGEAQEDGPFLFGFENVDESTQTDRRLSSGSCRSLAAVPLQPAGQQIQFP